MEEYILAGPLEWLSFVTGLFGLLIIIMILGGIVSWIYKFGRGNPRSRAARSRLDRYQSGRYDPDRFRSTRPENRTVQRAAYDPGYSGMDTSAENSAMPEREYDVKDRISLYSSYVDENARHSDDQANKQYERQKSACLDLQNEYFPKNNLIKLFKNQKYVEWSNVNDVQIDSWHFLKNTGKEDGLGMQQEFIKKAMGTPDFALLEGPPGSGKTTVLCELVRQMMSSEKRVMVCASTHVAVDNILEKLSENMPESDLRSVIRMGMTDNTKISEKAREFIPDDKEDYDKIANAKVVFGTTSGIMHYFELKKPPFNQHSTPAFADIQFDMMILDEASKTTFQEFLVPASHAERWIIVGDTKQLTPYSDIETVGKIIESRDIHEYGELCLDVFSTYKGKQLVIIPANDPPYCDDLKYDYKLQCDKLGVKFYDADQMTENIVQPGIMIGTTDSLLQISPKMLQMSPKMLQMSPKISKIVVVDRDFMNTFCSKLNMLKNKMNHDESIRLEKLIDRIRPEESQRNWGSEIAWRLKSDYERIAFHNDLHNVPKLKYRKDVDMLVPVNDENKKIEKTIRDISLVAFPSILELLQFGNRYSKLKQNASEKSNDSAIMNGIPRASLDKRHVLLTYQFRMHPDIASFSSKWFYHDKALKTSDEFRSQRESEHDHAICSEKRLIWRDVSPTNNFNENTEENIGEVYEILDILENFSKLSPEKINNIWKIGILTFYNKQKELIEKEREKAYRGNHNKIHSNDNASVKVGTVDSFQGHEFDLVFLSIGNSRQTEFLKNPNRLNVAITRARHLCIIVGNRTKLNSYKNNQSLEKLYNNGEFLSLLIEETKEETKNDDK